MTPAVLEEDGVLLREVDAALARGARRAGAHLVCRAGCTPCCVGPFDITVLDAARLRSGWERLRRRAPGRAAAVARRAAAAWTRLAEGFPGDVRSGRLADDDGAREAFFARHAAEPCPALDPGTGRCDLYPFRPLSCRTFGLPVRSGGVELEPCELCFRGATPAEVAAATVEPDPHDREGRLLAVLAAAGSEGETVVAAVLAAAEAETE